MRTSGRWWCILAVYALLAANGFALPTVRGETPPTQTDNVSNVLVTSVLRHKDTIFAVTDAGLYRADLRDKVWHKLPLPASAPKSGYLAREAVPSSLLVYCTGSSSIVFPTDEPATFFVSEDDGETWTRTSTGHHFTDVYVQTDGAIYADEVTHFRFRSPRIYKGAAAARHHGVEKREPRYRVVVSRDFGKSWRDISEGLDPGLEYVFHQSLDHPELVRLNSTHEFFTVRASYYEADSKDYHWRKIPEKLWREDPRERRRDDISAGVSLSSLLK